MNTGISSSRHASGFVDLPEGIIEEYLGQDLILAAHPHSAGAVSGILMAGAEQAGTRHMWSTSMMKQIKSFQRQSSH